MSSIPSFLSTVQPATVDAVSLAVARARVNEGFRSLPYHDTQGLLTIGYGCNLDAGWDQGLAETVLQYQMRKSEQQLHNYPWYTGLDVVRQSVMAEMCFNLGLGRLLGFHDTLAALGRKDWQAAHDGMLASLWSRQVGLRATTLAALMLNGA